MPRKKSSNPRQNSSRRFLTLSFVFGGFLGIMVSVVNSGLINSGSLRGQAFEDSPITDATWGIACTRGSGRTRLGISGVAGACTANERCSRYNQYLDEDGKEVIEYRCKKVVEDGGNCQSVSDCKGAYNQATREYQPRRANIRAYCLKYDVLGWNDATDDEIPIEDRMGICCTSNGSNGDCLDETNLEMKSCTWPFQPAGGGGAPDPGDQGGNGAAGTAAAGGDVSTTGGDGRPPRPSGPRPGPNPQPNPHPSAPPANGYCGDGIKSGNEECDVGIACGDFETCYYLNCSCISTIMCEEPNSPEFVD